MEYIDGEILGVVSWSERTSEQQHWIIQHATQTLYCIGKMQGHSPGPVGSDLVVYHFDTSLRKDKAGRLWIIDGTWAGFFLPGFETASLLHICVDDSKFDIVQCILCELHYQWALPLRVHVLAGALRLIIPMREKTKGDEFTARTARVNMFSKAFSLLLLYGMKELGRGT
ncbi:hypothetical protein BU24DRAFT_471248 [Aaosphaeria arxii CBS 175.79]|uniref:Uncharacterized protein n=1 Tax=Aaosphaeria arxii CBS 175.79 TaxID=1450172 RepID=A0A6A5YBT0_9PLEO|nr:uncharacterized protein BU24DRAFT_471248 [Aaosphaeria arxii CBS 175.79]KAF2022140.1 hypothetical protein BU24DRAFT_471248 [Aaosphaeria arxii CBS 175.79]